MDYSRGDAPSSWAAETMGKHLLPIDVELHGDFTGNPPTATGTLTDIEGEDLILDCGPGYEELRISGRDITGIDILPEKIDVSDELRG